MQKIAAYENLVEVLQAEVQKHTAANCEVQSRLQRGLKSVLKLKDGLKMREGRGFDPNKLSQIDDILKELKQGGDLLRAVDFVT